MTLFIGLVIIAVIAWLAIRGRMIRLRAEIIEALRQQAERGRPRQVGENMVACPRCGTYAAPAQQRNCGQPGCPYPAKAALRDGG